MTLAPCTVVSGFSRTGKVRLMKADTTFVPYSSRSVM